MHQVTLTLSLFLLFLLSYSFNWRTATPFLEYNILNKFGKGRMKGEDELKRRGRPEKRRAETQSVNDGLFSIHDNIFHAAVLFYTTRIFSQTPSKSKFNPTIGYSIYQKVKQLNPQQKQYYSHDSTALEWSKKYSKNPAIVNFFINSLTFAPQCVINQYFQLFIFILDSLEQPTTLQSLNFIHQQKFQYLNFDCRVLDVLDVKTPESRKMVRELIDLELSRLLDIVTYTLWALKQNSQQNHFISILDNDQDLFERGSHHKGRKKTKIDFQ